MDWGGVRVDWGDVPAWVAAGLAFIFGVLSWWSSRKSKADADRAQRTADSLASLAAETRRLADATVKASSVKWVLEPQDAGSWHLVNDSPTTAFNVIIWSTHMFKDKKFDRIDAHSYGKIFALFGNGQRLTVTYNLQENGEDSPIVWDSLFPS